MTSLISLPQISCRWDFRAVSTVWVLWAVFASSAAALEPFELFSLERKPPGSILKVESLTEPVAAAPGDPVTIYVKVQVAEGWHIYSMRFPEEGESLATRIELAGEVFHPAGPWQEPEPAITRDGALERVVPVHTGAVEFSRKGTVADTLASGIHEISGALAYRACDNKTCTLPREAAFTTRLEIASP